MSPLDSNISCPSCSRALRPKILVCDDCGVQVEGPFQLNEFSRLSPEDLHFLRIFVHCEGRIREMESPLGLSYPTIRARLTALKNRIEGFSPEATADSGSQAKAAEASDPAIREALEQLRDGEIGFDEAMKRIRKRR